MKEKHDMRINYKMIMRINKDVLSSIPVLTITTIFTFKFEIITHY